MEMERINDDTIRVTIGPDDLSERGVSFLDLMGDHQQIENFFYGILEEVDTDHQFSNNDSVTFQVLPNRNGLELYISKNPNEAMGQIIKSAQAGDKESEAELDDVSQFLKHKLSQTDSDTDASDDDQDPADFSTFGSDSKSQTTTILKLHDFESLPKIADLMKIEGLESKLYKYENEYYLELTFYSSENSPELIQDQLAIAYEYAVPTKIAPEVLQEHGKVIMAQAALELSRHYFD